MCKSDDDIDLTALLASLEAQDPPTLEDPDMGALLAELARQDAAMLESLLQPDVCLLCGQPLPRAREASAAPMVSASGATDTNMTTARARKRGRARRGK